MFWTAPVVTSTPARQDSAVKSSLPVSYLWISKLFGFLNGVELSTLKGVNQYFQHVIVVFKFSIFVCVMVDVHSVNVVCVMVNVLFIDLSNDNLLVH